MSFSRRDRRADPTPASPACSLVAFGGGACGPLPLRARSLASLALLHRRRVVAPAMHGQTRPASKPVVSAGNGTLYVGTYKGVIFEIDEATEKIKREIPVSVGIPIGLTLSDDMSRIYVRDAGYEKVEIIDRVKGTSLGTFTLTEGKAKTRIWAMRPDPQHKTLILTTKKYTLESDRWVIGPPTLVQYNIDQRKIVRTIPWPKGEEREGVNVHVFARRQAPLHVRRGHPHLRDDELHRSRSLGRNAADRAGRRAPSASADSPQFGDEPGFYHGVLHDAGSRAEPPDHGSRPHRARKEEDRLPPDRSRHAAWALPSRPTASAATACSRPSRTSSSGRSTSKAIA